MRTIICDIDGVLADNSHRLHYMEEKDYVKFYSDEEIMKDSVIPAGYALVKLLANEEIDGPVGLIFLTGRNEICRDATIDWLNIIGITGGYRLIMRKNGDHRPSPEVKVEMASELNMACMEIFIDDDPKNVKAMEEAYPMVKGIIFGTSRLSSISDK